MTPIPIRLRVANAPRPGRTGELLNHDLQVQRELDRLSGASPGPLAAVWIMFLPPNVGPVHRAWSCGSDAYSAITRWPISGARADGLRRVPTTRWIEFTLVVLLIPKGIPRPRALIDTPRTSLVESLTDPEGTGWMDPDGFEVDFARRGPRFHCWATR